LRLGSSRIISGEGEEGEVSRLPYHSACRDLWTVEIVVRKLFLSNALQIWVFLQRWANAAMWLQ
jgi:hypothetical protein